jgi:peptide/nickel transport system substrate-binding protein
LVIAALLLSTAGFAFQVVRTAEAQEPAELRIGFLEPIDYLNPFRGLNDPSFELYGMLYDYLYSVDEDGNLVENLAVDATQDAYGANWTYQIRQGVSWSDGTPLTEEDVNFTINYNIADFNLLFNYEPYFNHVVQCSVDTEPYCGAKITSPWNVTVYYDGPFVSGKAVFAPIVQKAQWENVGLDEAQSSYENLNPIGTGPFIADTNIGTQWRNHQPIVVHRNPNYHQVGDHVVAPAIDNLYMIQFSDENQMIGALKTGAIDLGKFTSDGYDLLANSPNIARQEGLICTQYWNQIAISQYDNPDLNPARYDENVRRAMAMATNKDYIVSTIYNGRGVRGSGLMTPITPQWFFDPTQYPGVNLTFDIAAANDLLNASGYTTWSGGSFGDGVRSATNDISFTDTNGIDRTIPAGTPLVFTMDVRQEFIQEKDVGSYLTAEWARIGIQLLVTAKLDAALSADVFDGAVDTYIWYWSGDPDPNYLLSIQSFYTLDGWNDNYWDNETYNELYVKQLADFDFNQRQEDVRAAQMVHYNSSVYIIYIYPYGEWGWRTDTFTGWGDWNAHPYRQMNNFWGANPLFLDLTPIAGPGGGISTALIVALGVVAVVAVAVVVMLVLRARGKGKKEEEARVELPKK